MKKDKKLSVTKTIALAGNPNSGKTTLFNLLTGSNQHIGNWPGVTVERKEGRLVSDPSVKIVDLPGIYSLSPLSLDEKIAYRYLTEEKPDIIINIVDATNLERNLFLTTQLLEIGCDMVVGLNMLDELESQGKKIDENKLSEIYGVKFFSISAGKNRGVGEMIKYALGDGLSKPKPVKITKTSKDEIAAERYVQISKTVCAVLTDRNMRALPGKEVLTVSDKIDRVVTNKWLAFPIFAVVMTLIFYISIDGLGGYLSDLLSDRLFPWLSETVRAAMSQLPLWLSSLVVDGIMAGVLSVVGFVPQIMLLFGFISALEASGYMARVAFIMDRLFNKIGLNGKSFVAIIIGCGCSVPAIMSARTIKNINERNSTITLAPMMPCSAKLALFSYFTAVVFDGNGLVAVSLYFVSIISIIIGGLLLKIFNRKKTDVGDTFIMELPTYRIPQPKNVLREMWERGKAFLVKAGTVIFVASVILWFLQSFDFRLTMVSPDQSMLAAIGKLIAPIFVPLGWGNWQFSVATLSGLAAKETVVSTLKILYADTPISSVISPLAAYSFLTFNLLAAPCIAAISASFKEQGKAKYGWLSIAFQTGLAYVVSFLIYQIGTLATVYSTGFWTILIVAAIIAALYLCIRFLAKRKGCNYECHHCPYKDSCNKKR